MDEGRLHTWLHASLKGGSENSNY